MTRDEAIKEVNKAFDPAFANYIITALTEGATTSDKCEDCVSRQAVLDMATTIQTDDCSGNETLEVVETDDIKALPSVTPTRKKGKWIIDDEERGKIWHCHCSKCKKDPQDYIGGTENWWLVRLPDYCPNCGIEMEEE